MQVTPDILLGTVAGLLSSAFYAVAVIIYKAMGQEIRPIAVSAIKMWVSLAFISVLVLLPFRTTPFYVPFESVIALGVSITIGTVIGDTAYLVSQDRIGVSYAFPIACAYPIGTYVLAFLFLGEQIVGSRVLGVLAAVTGIVLISRGQNPRSESGERKRSSDVFGIVLALVALVLYSVSTVLIQVGMTGVDPIDGNLVRMLVGSVEFVPAFALAKRFGMPLPSKHGTKVIIIAAFFGMALESLLYLASIKYAGATIGSVLGSTSPLFGVPIAYVYLKERVSKLESVGIAATIVGVFLTVIVL